MVFPSKPKWQELIATRKFNIEQVAKMVSADWDNFAESQNYPATIENAIAVPAPSLAVYKKYEDESATLSVIAKMILWTLKMLNVQKSQNDFQVLMTAKMILSDYYFLSLTEIKYCFVRGIHGDFGQLYAKVDAMDLLKWLKEYSEARATHLIYENQKKSKADKVELSNAKFNPAMFEMVKGTIAKINKKEQERQKKKQLQLCTARIAFSKRIIEQLQEMQNSEHLNNEGFEIAAVKIENEERNIEKIEMEFDNLKNG